MSKSPEWWSGWERGWGIGTHFAKVGVLFFVTGIARCLCRSLCHLFPLLLLFYVFCHLAGTRQHLSKVNSTPGAAWKCSCMHRCMHAACLEARAPYAAAIPSEQRGRTRACWATLKRLCFVRRWKPLSLYKRPFFADDTMSAESALTPPAPE
jgi:hypothetical protein